MKHILHTIQAKTTSRSQREVSLQDQLASVIAQTSPIYLRLGDSDLVAELKLAEYNDLEELVELQLLAYDGYMAWTLRDFREDWRYNKQSIYLVLIDQTYGQMIGAITGRRLHVGAHISQLFVDPRLQGQGVGDYLLGQWLNILRCLGVDRCSLEVRESNLVAQALYHKYGFRQVRSKRGYYHDNQETAFIMTWMDDSHGS